MTASEGGGDIKQFLLLIFIRIFIFKPAKPHVPSIASDITAEVGDITAVTDEEQLGASLPMISHYFANVFAKSHHVALQGILNSLNR